MPFDKYLQDANTNGNANGNGTANGVPFSESHALGFQIPQFMYAGPPTLAPGGGAEVLSFNPSVSLASTWFNNNRFSLPGNTSYVSVHPRVNARV